MNTVERVWQIMTQQNMLTPADTVVVGVSGGADSVALLHILLTLQREKGIPARLVAAHIQHNLRGEESRQDEAFVRQLCADRGVECRVKEADVAALAIEWGTGTEDAGRRVRYAFFEELAKEFAPAKIATAHNRKDNMETVLLHLTRGSGLQGVGGIPPIIGNRIRPLICCSREEIEGYCAENGLAYRQDSTNADTAYSRNRIRQEVLPALSKINPQAEEAFLRFSEIARQDDACLQALAADLVAEVTRPEHRYRLAPIQTAPPSIGARALRQIIHAETGVLPETTHIRELLALPEQGGEVTLPGGHRVVDYHGDLCFPKTADPPAPAEDTPVEWGRDYVICGKTYSLSLLSLEEYENKQKVHKILLKNALDYAMIVDGLYWHARRPGDVFRSKGRPAKTLKKWFNELAVPPWQRQEWPILRDRDGIVWMAEGGSAERVAVTANTKQILCITIKDV